MRMEKGWIFLRYKQILKNRNSDIINGYFGWWDVSVADMQNIRIKVGIWRVYYFYWNTPFNIGQSHYT